MNRFLAIAAVVGLSLLGPHMVLAQTTQPSPLSPNDPDFVTKAATIRALAGRSHRGGVSGPVQSQAAQQFAAQQMLLRQQQAAAQQAAAKRAEKKEKTRAAAAKIREQKAARK